MQTKGYKKDKAVGAKAIARNYALLKTSWNLQAKLFFKHSTLHGVRYIAEAGRPFIEKFLWLACVAMGAVATMIIIVSLWEKFQTNPTITGLDTDFHNWEVPFPAITICQSVPSNSTAIEDYVSKENNENVDKLSEFLVKLTQLSFENIKEFQEYADDKYITDDVDLKQVVFELMNKCEDIFDTCTWKSSPYNCCDGFLPVFTENGFCYSFNSRHYERTVPGRSGDFPDFKMQYIKETDVKWSLKFKIQPTNESIVMPVYIHNSDDVPGLDMQPQHVWDYRVNRISFSVKQTYTTSDARQLSVKQRHCIFEDEVKLKIDRMYTYTACTGQCRMENSMKLCKCVPHFYPKVAPFRHCRLSELRCIAENLDEIIATDKCSCELGCSNTVYEVEKLSDKGSSPESYELESEFVSWPMVRYKREVLFGWVDLLVSFGGIAGLFLGFSLLSGVEVLYYFTLRACCMVYKEKNELIKVKMEEKLKPKPDYDLSLVPYFVRRPLPGNGMDEVAKGYLRRNLNLYNNEITVSSLNKNKVQPEPIYPPFGIEFLN